MKELQKKAVELMDEIAWHNKNILDYMVKISNEETMIKEKEKMLKEIEAKLKA
jgi:hypothetical protein